MEIKEFLFAFLGGAVPAFLCVWIPRAVNKRREGKAGGKHDVLPTEEE